MNTQAIQKYLPDHHDSLIKYILYVSILHILVNLLLWLTNSGLDLFSFGQREVFVKSAIKVDVVGMPKMTLKELKNAVPDFNSIKEPPPQAKVEEKAPEPESKEEFKVQDQVDLMAKLKNLSKKNIKKSKKRAKVKKIDNKDSLSKSQREELKKLVFEGNQISKGGSLTGDMTSQDIGALQEYMEMIPQYVRPSWKLPSYLKDKELKCRYRIFISGEGKLIKTKLYESSGDQEYDQRALEAIEKTQFAKPPETIVKDLVKGVVILGFPL